jgi:transposase-like protein
MYHKRERCYHCGSESLIKNGKDPNGKQRYQCKDCKRASGENPDYGYSEARKEELIKAYQERSSMRGISRTFGISRQTLSSWLKKARTTPPLEQTLVEPDAPEKVELELDEMWSFVPHKSKKRWVWLAVCRQTRQVVAGVIGGRGIATCQELWENIPELYKQGLIFSDFWEAYQTVMPDEQHQPARTQV